jgi:hypothetical protein
MGKQKGIEKQVPADQRGRGKNPENSEGQANIRNQQGQNGAAPAPAAPKPAGGK